MKTQLSRLFSLLVLAALFACHPSPEYNRGHDSVEKIVDRTHLSRDLLSPGPYAFDESLYAEPAAIDHDILPLPPSDLPEVLTDIRGKLYLPQGAGPFPLLVFLHGNHPTCGTTTGENNPRIDTAVDFTFSGECPEGMIEAPSYLGYEYSARHLASWGYAVVSINANRGITGRDGYDFQDVTLVYARGALVLKHLIKLRQWSLTGPNQAFADPQLDIQNKFDFEEVGLMGHSRGGEGVRFAYNIYQQADAESSWKKALPNLKIKGVFEIAPVDFGTGEQPIKVEAMGTAWTGLIAGCDRDVSNFMGTNTYGRMLSSEDSFPKAVFTVWGANHNFFNSEWQVSDAPHTCIGNQKPLWNTAAEPIPAPYSHLDPNALSGVKGSPVQQTFAQGLMFSFFKSNVGKFVDPTLLHSFDPQYALPQQLNELSPSSREFILLNSSLLVAKPGKGMTTPLQIGDIRWQSLDDKLKGDLPQLQEFWNRFARDNGYQQLKVQLMADSLTREALMLDAAPLLTEQIVDIPFEKAVDASDYWTIDASLASRSACYSYPETSCVPDYSDAEVDIALVQEDGTSSAFVHLTDYINLQNYHNNFFEIAATEPIANSQNSFNLEFSYVPLLFTTARFELSDFAMPNLKLKALRLKFPAGKAVALAIDELRLVKRSAASIAH